MNVEYGYTTTGTFASSSNKIHYRASDKLFVNEKNNYNITVENVLNTLLYHEWLGHIKQGHATTVTVRKAIESDNPLKRFFGMSDYVPDDVIKNTHYKCYENSILSPLWPKTTSGYKGTVFLNYFKMRKDEGGVINETVEALYKEYMKSRNK